MAAARRRVSVDGAAQKVVKDSGSYFTSEKPLSFFSSGCELLDQVLGGGYVLGRITNVVGDRSVGKCIRNGYIAPEGKGLVKIDDQMEDLKYGITPLSQVLVVDKNTKLLATHAYKESVNLTVKITTKHGFEIECTPSHPILMFTENCEHIMTPVRDLTAGEYCVISKGTNNFGNNQEVTPDLAFLLGAIVANGCNPVFGRIEVSTRQEYLQSLLEGVLTRLGLPCKVTSIGQDGDGVQSFCKEYAIYLWKRFFKEKDDFTARYKFVPDAVLDSCKESQAAFLRALIDADGYCKPADNYFEYYTASEQLAKQVQLMLLNFGVVSNRKGIHGAYIGEKYYDHTYWTISFGGKYFNTYAANIGSDKYDLGRSAEKGTSDFDSIPYLLEKMHDVRNALKPKLGWSKNGKLRDGTRFNAWNASSYTSATYNFLDYFLQVHEDYKDLFDYAFYEEFRTNSYHYDPIVKIEVFEHESNVDVFDVHVPVTHRFWCNGFISHNTLLAIEASVNFVNTYSDGIVRYCEAEAAFDPEYAEALGMPLESVTFTENVFTVEELFEDLEKTLDELKGRPCLYIVDSLDALSDKAELERKIDEGSFGLGKPKILGQLFRRLIKKIEASKMCLVIISQVRENVGVTFGETKTRTGGKALDFYASQIVWLADVGKITKEIQGVKRITGVNIVAKCKKNKIGLPYRDCAFSILFGYGVDDVLSMAEWLAKVVKREDLLEELGLSKSRYNSTLAKLRDEGGIGYKKMRMDLKVITKKLWREIEEGFIPKTKKY